MNNPDRVNEEDMIPGLNHNHINEPALIDLNQGDRRDLIFPGGNLGVNDNALPPV